MTQVTAPQPTTSPTSPGAPASANLPEAGFVAVATAEAEVPGSKAVELDLNDDGTWQVEVILGERKHEFEISADGTQIVEREESDADSDDVYRLVQVKVELIEAVRIAMARYAGEFDEIDLTSEDGVIVWEISLDDPDDVEVYVDVASGEIVESITDAVNR